MAHVLIVEDQVEVRRMLRAALEALRPDIHVMDIPSGEEALLVLSRQRVDLAVLDVRLAGISGLELMRKARQRNPNLKVILITGLADPVIRQQIMASGADDFFFKPLEISAFIKAVDHCIGALQPDSPEELEAINLAEAQADRFENHCKAGQEESQGACTAKEIDLAGWAVQLLSNFRDEIGAISILLIEPDGLILAQSGELPGELPEPALLSLASSAFRLGREVSILLQQDHPLGRLFYSGNKHDLVLLQGDRTGLLAVLSASSPGEARPDISMQAFPMLDEISTLLRDEAGRAVAETAPNLQEMDVEAEGAAQAATDLEVIFSLLGQKGYEPKDIQAFWDLEGSVKEQETGPEEGKLSLEQAREFGLGPDVMLQ